MRRLAVLTLAAALASAAALGLTIAPASAHICARPAEIAVGQPSTIAVGVTVEATAVPDVEITLPAGLRLDRIDTKAGWTSTRNGPSVRFHGGPIPAFRCEYFFVGVTAPARGSFGIAVLQRAADGTVVARSTPDPNNASDRALGQIVYAGMKPPAAPSGSTGPSTATIVGIALIGVGIIAAGLIRFRARREHPLDDDREPDGDGDGDGDGHGDGELRARLERFKKRTPDPPPG